jgi:predicted TIM-barrel fold metal-dependent hydrolase
VRHSAGWDADEIIGNSASITGPHLMCHVGGAARCMFESNYPVEKMGISWVTLWNAFKHVAAGASETEKLALFSGTARRVYRLDI